MSSREGLSFPLGGRAEGGLPPAPGGRLAHGVRLAPPGPSCRLLARAKGGAPPGPACGGGPHLPLPRPLAHARGGVRAAPRLLPPPGGLAGPRLSHRTALGQAPPCARVCARGARPPPLRFPRVPPAGGAARPFPLRSPCARRAAAPPPDPRACGPRNGRKPILCALTTAASTGELDTYVMEPANRLC